MNSSGNSGGGVSAGPATASGVAYYVDKTNGNDSNSGRTIDSPWKTLSKINQTQFAEKSVAFLKRGEVWNEALVISSSGLTIDAYGTGALPEINGAVPVSGWVNEGGGIFSKLITYTIGDAFGNISENGSLMTFLSWQSNVATTFAGSPTGAYSFDASSSKIYIKTALNPVNANYFASRTLYGVRAVGVADIALQNINIKRFSLHGVHFESCQRCSVTNSTISEGGGAIIGFGAGASSLYAGNGIEFSGNSNNGVVSNVTINNVFDSCVSPQTFVSYNSISNVQIQNSTFSRCGFAGVEISVLNLNGAVQSSISGVTISGVNISDSGRGWSGRRYNTEGHGIRIVTDYGAGTMSGISVNTTQITNSAGDGIKIAGDVGQIQLNRLKISENRHGINISSPTTSNLSVKLASSQIYKNSNYGIYVNAPNAPGPEIYHTTFYNNTGINLGILGVGSPATVQNNVFYSSSPMTHVYGSTSSVAFLDYNCYNNVANMFGFAAVTYSTVAALTSGAGLEAHGVGGNVNLADPNNGNFTLLSSSQCRAMGSPLVGISKDYNGLSFSAPPSAGSLEF